MILLWIKSRGKSGQGGRSTVFLIAIFALHILGFQQTGKAQTFDIFSARELSATSGAPVFAIIGSQT